MLNRAAEHLENILSAEFAPFPKWGDAEWKNLPEEATAYLLSLAEEAAKQEIPATRASLYMDFQRNGNRTRYENVCFARRDRLFNMLVAECIDAKGRFIDPIIDMVWAICEETSWVIPAHNTRMSGLPLDPLPDFEEEAPHIDLFSAETGSLLSWVHYFLADRLNEESIFITKRIEQEIRRRILIPYLKYDSFWWMGFKRNRRVNNWNPWINSNVQIAFLLMEKDPATRAEGLKKVARSSQRFIDAYHEDGGCDEGPSYFSAAGASLLDILETFHDATNGQFNLYGESLIRNMADYIRHVHIAEGYFVNFADAPCKLANLPAGLLIRTGQFTDNPELVGFARGLYRDGIAQKPWLFLSGHRWMLFRLLKSLLTYSETDLLSDEKPGARSHYFPGIQVLTARSAAGMFFAAKGGHNDESHNHNDVGSYVIYRDNQPCVVDAGVGIYSKKTFSDQRYSIWSMQSGYHNTAIINGCDQLNGAEYAAHSVECLEKWQFLQLSMNLEKAYAPEAKLTGFRREFAFDRLFNTLSMTDRIDVEACTEPVQLPILCCEPPVIGKGYIDINGLRLHYLPSQFSASVEEVRLDDPENPMASWGKDTLYRLLLTRTEMKTSDQWTITYMIL